MRLSIQKWGNSAAVRLPAALVHQMGAGIGSELSVTLTKTGLLLEPQRKRYDLADLVRGITAENRHEEVDWGASVGQEHSA